jgi:hypothetical protein
LPLSVKSPRIELVRVEEVLCGVSGGNKAICSGFVFENIDSSGQAASRAGCAAEVRML